jgi:glycosyltransferase involved in cell wall biosynthesis
MWYHDWNDPVRFVQPRKLRLQAQLRADAHVALHNLSRVTAVGVSKVHSENIRAHLSEARAIGAFASRVQVDYVYNPIPDDLTKTEAAYDATKLVFVSAAWKGLDMVLSTFQAVRRAIPEMQLHVASPGYAEGLLPRPGQTRDGVTYLGSLSHASVIEELRSALCVFYPANLVPETFGCVFAESHAVGTPVLAHPFGAACELLGDDELVDARNIGAVVERVRAWRHGARPVVSVNPAVRLSSTARAWERLLFAEPETVSESLALAPSGVAAT